MTRCRLCRSEWDHSGSSFSVCRPCRSQMPVRRVNMEPLFRPFRLLPVHPKYAEALNTPPELWVLPASLAKFFRSPV